MGDLMYEGENYAELLTTKYAEDILKLSRYIPYFENKKGSDVATKYEGEDGQATLKFPVYDSTLLAFTKEAAETCQKRLDCRIMDLFRLSAEEQWIIRHALH